MHQADNLSMADRGRLVLLSFLMLFVELALIRFAGENVIYLSYFSNFVLLGSFLGIGVGFLRARARTDLFPWSIVILTFLVGFILHLSGRHQSVGHRAHLFRDRSGRSPDVGHAAGHLPRGGGGDGRDRTRRRPRLRPLRAVGSLPPRHSRESRGDRRV